jgi:hypothetical protein
LGCFLFLKNNWHILEWVSVNSFSSLHAIILLKKFFYLLTSARSTFVAEMNILTVLTSVWQAVLQTSSNHTVRFRSDRFKQHPPLSPKFIKELVFIVTLFSKVSWHLGRYQNPQFLNDAFPIFQ